MSTKSKSIALLLSIFFGTWGAHRFYVGKSGSAVIMLVISCTIVGLIITGPWALIDFIRILANKFEDQDGNVVAR